MAADIHDKFYAWLAAFYPDVEGWCDDGAGFHALDPTVQTAIDTDLDFQGTLDAFYAPTALAQAKAEKDTLIEAERDRRMLAVQWVQHPGRNDKVTYQIKATPDWTALMDKVKGMLDRPAVAATFPRVWHGAIGPLPTLSIEEFLEMVDTIFLGLDHVYQRAANHRQKLAALTTIDAVQAFPTWPSA